jgi:glycosyltransferase involved in cell wall biosynthesis
MIKKKVVIVSDALAPWHKGGKEERYEQLVKNFQSDEIEIIFASMKWWQGKDPQGYVSICPRISMYNSDGGRSVWQSIRFAIACLKVYRMKPDLIECDQIPFLQIFTLWFVAKLRRIPMTVTWHEVWGLQYWQEYAPRIARFASVCEKLTIRLPDRIIANSEFTANRLRAFGVTNNRIFVIENKLDIEFMEKASTDLAGYQILFAGRLIAHKRVDILLKAMEILKLEHPNVCLGIIGGGPESKTLKQIAFDLKIEGNVKFLGEISQHEDVIGIMKKSEIFVSASEREGYGQSVLEALYLGLNVIVADCPNNAAIKIVNNSRQGIVLKENIPQLYADTISELLTKQKSEPFPNFKLYSETLSSLYLHEWKEMLSCINH